MSENPVTFKSGGVNVAGNLYSHALDYADLIVVPYLGVVGAEAVTRPYTERFVEAKTQGSNEIKVIEGAYHVQAYDRPEYVSQAVGALSRFFQQHLAA
jgi:fermentation-respiration switch protein FrsA (DUF1100 family)